MLILYILFMPMQKKKRTQANYIIYLLYINRKLFLHLLCIHIKTLDILDRLFLNKSSKQNLSLLHIKFPSYTFPQ